MQEKNTTTLETERLLLRKFSEQDIEAMLRIFADKETNRFLPWYPVKDRDEAQRFKADNIPIGYVNVSLDEAHDFGYGLRQEFWHQGIATEAGAAVIAQVRADGLPYLTATHDRNNPRSGEVMRKLGMTYCYSYEEQWQPKDFSVIFRMYQLNLNCAADFVYRKYWEISAHHFVERL